MNNFKIRLAVFRTDIIPDEVDLVISDKTEETEVTYIGTIRDYFIAQEIVKRWNAYNS